MTTTAEITSPTAARRRARWVPWSAMWLAEWFAKHGFSEVPVGEVAPAVLAACVGAEFDSWCEAQSVTARAQTRARTRAARQLPGGEACDGVRSAARDVAAWHSLRTGHLHLAS